MSNIETTRVMGAAGIAPNPTLTGSPGMGGATMQMPAANDPMRTQMGGTTVCPVCKSSTPLMDPYCGDCGFRLDSTPAETLVVPEEEAAPAELVDSQNGRRYRLHDGVNTVGRQGTDVLVSEGTVSRVHAKITVENGTVLIEDLGSSNGTKVGDHRLAANQPVQVMTGMPVRFGNWNLTLEIGNNASPAPQSPGGISASDKTLAGAAFVDEDTFLPLMGLPLTGVVSPGAPASVTGEQAKGDALVATLRKTDGLADDIEIAEGTVTIGRRPGNTVVLTGDAYVSGKHVEIVTDDTGVYLADCGSTNGTVLNGEALMPHIRHKLAEGDAVHIGQSKFRFEPASASEPPDTGQQSEPSASEPVPQDAESGIPWRAE